VATTNPRARLKRAGWILLASGVAWFDLWSKDLWTYPAQGSPGQQVDVFPSWIQVLTVWNKGGVWSVPLSRDLLKWATALAIPVLAAWIFWTRRPRVLESLGKALVLGGALGNLYDRLRWGMVRDWIDVYFGGKGGWHWPTFNVADIALVVGIGLLLLCSFVHREGKGPEAA